jgi:hypothetical protein
MMMWSCRQGTPNHPPAAMVYSVRPQVACIQESGRIINSSDGDLVPENWRKTWENIEKMATWYRLVLWENMGPHSIFMIFEYILNIYLMAFRRNLIVPIQMAMKWGHTMVHLIFRRALMKVGICCIFKLPPWWEPPQKNTNTSQIISICFGKLGIGVLSSGVKGSAKCLDSVSWWCNSIWNSSGHQRLDGKISGARS